MKNNNNLWWIPKTKGNFGYLKNNNNNSSARLNEKEAPWNLVIILCNYQVNGFWVLTCYGTHFLWVRRGKNISFREAQSTEVIAVHLESSELSLCGSQDWDFGHVIYGSIVVAGAGDLDSSSYDAPWMKELLQYPRALPHPLRLLSRNFYQVTEQWGPKRRGTLTFLWFDLLVRVSNQLDIHYLSPFYSCFIEVSYFLVIFWIFSLISIFVFLPLLEMRPRIQIPSNSIRWNKTPPKWTRPNDRELQVQSKWMRYSPLMWRKHFSTRSPFTNHARNFIHRYGIILLHRSWTKHNNEIIVLHCILKQSKRQIKC